MSKVFIRADATEKIGTGHVMRCLALAQEWKREQVEVVFLSYCESDTVIGRIKSHEVGFVPLDIEAMGSRGVMQVLGILDRLRSRSLAGSDWVVVDGYQFDADYQKCIRDEGFNILWIDDYGHAMHYYADIVLNQNISADVSTYSCRESYTRLLLGTEYSLLRQEFGKWIGWKRKIPELAQRILVTLGGADPENVTCEVARALKAVKIPGLQAKIVLGPSNSHYKEVERDARVLEFEVDLIRSADDMPQLMSWADIAVSASGSTSLELAFMGLPSILIVLSRDQEAIADKFNSIGTCINLGSSRKLDSDTICETLSELIYRRDRRFQMSICAQKLVDGRGCSRVVKAMNETWHN